MLDFSFYASVKNCPIFDATSENPVELLERLLKVFSFPIQIIQTDNGAEFICKSINETEKSPFDTAFWKPQISSIS